jgi:hypothetical protein
MFNSSSPVADLDVQIARGRLPRVAEDSQNPRRSAGINVARVGERSKPDIERAGTLERARGCVFECSTGNCENPVAGNRNLRLGVLPLWLTVKSPPLSVIVPLLRSSADAC